MVILCPGLPFNLGFEPRSPIIGLGVGPPGPRPIHNPIIVDDDDLSGGIESSMAAEEAEGLLQGEWNTCECMVSFRSE